MLCFLAHIALVFNLTRLNRAARGQDYSVKASKQRGTLGRALVSTYMGVSGLVVLIFVIVHVADMRMARGTYESLYDHIHSVLGVGWKAGLYMVGSAFVGWHLWHGFQSSFRSLGLGHAKYSPLLEKAGTALSIVLTIGFVSIPLWILKGGRDDLGWEVSRRTARKSLEASQGEQPEAGRTDQSPQIQSDRGGLGARWSLGCGDAGRAGLSSDLHLVP